MDEWVLNVPRAHWPGPALFRFFETKRSVVVLSSSNKADVETHEQACAAQGVPILRRKGGGGAVVLGPGCVVLTLAFEAREPYANARYFNLVNDLWCEALVEACGLRARCVFATADREKVRAQKGGASGQEGLVTLKTRGISDIALGERKLVGTSVFRRKHLFVYQGSLLVDPDFDSISRLLAHPSREPDYRAGRGHRGFLTSLAEHGVTLPAFEVARRCDAYFRPNIAAALEADILPPAARD